MPMTLSAGITNPTLDVHDVNWPLLLTLQRPTATVTTSSASSIAVVFSYGRLLFNAIAAISTVILLELQLQLAATLPAIAFLIVTATLSKTEILTAAVNATVTEPLTVIVAKLCSRSFINSAVLLLSLLWFPLL